MLDAGCSILDTGCSIMDARFSILDTRYWIRDAEVGKSKKRFKVLGKELSSEGSDWSINLINQSTSSTFSDSTEDDDQTIKTN